MDAVNASATALGSLAIGPVAHQQRAVPVHDYIRRSEPIGIVWSASREFKFSHRGEAGAFVFAPVPNNRSAPFTEEEGALVRGRESALQVGNSSGRGAAPQIGQRRNSLVRMFLVEVRVTVVGPHEAVTDPDHIRAAIVFIIAHEHVQLVVERNVVNVAQPR